MVVVDNASSDSSVDVVRSAFPQVHVQVSALNLGFARAVNQAIGLATGLKILLLNPDTVIPPGTLESLCVALEQNPTFAAVGPLLLTPSGSIQSQGEQFKGWAEIFMSHVLGITGRPRSSNHQGFQVDWICGAAMMLRRSALEQVGLFDERFWMYAEDMEWCWRARKQGWSIAVVPGAHVYHCHGHSAESNLEKATLANVQSLIHWLWAYKGPQSVYLGKAILLAGLLVRAIRKALAGSSEAKVYLQVASKFLGG